MIELRAAGVSIVANEDLSPAECRTRAQAERLAQRLPNAYPLRHGHVWYVAFKDAAAAAETMRRWDDFEKQMDAIANGGIL